MGENTNLAYEAARCRRRAGAFLGAKAQVSTKVSLTASGRSTRRIMGDALAARLG
ncbi:hypothetical protein D3C71_1786640 [compost metagenome]